PADYCMLPDCQFAFLPWKCRPQLSLPVMKARSKSESSLLSSKLSSAKNRGAAAAGPAGAQSRGREKDSAPAQDQPAGTVSTCFGDFCDATFRYPGSLQDIESSEGHWMQQARQLCQREARPEGHQGQGQGQASASRVGVTRRATLLEPEEVVACLQAEPSLAEPRGVGGGGRSSSSSSKHHPRSSSKQQPRPPSSWGSAPHRKVAATLILEARGHPQLCRWLQERHWRLDTCEAAAIAGAAEQMRRDEQEGGGDISLITDVPSALTAGLRWRLKQLPVCATCLVVYSIIQEVVSLIRFSRHDLWAERELQRQKEDEEFERQREAREETDRIIDYQRQRRPRTASLSASDPS
ncbi:unnamed protein product, partial [Polarella glacialis]